MRERLKKTLYSTLGFFCIILALIGIFLPLLPTTPFIILAAFFFSQSSEKYHQWLLNSKIFGPLLYNWENSRCIPLFAKRLSFIMIAIFGSYSIYVIPLIAVKILTILLLSYGCYFIYKIQTCIKVKIMSKFTWLSDI
ncbi:MAG TPA: DUF454 domain-containing protein [Sulfurimonas sp.]|nr:DUF454 domain-containing protein [Sulfurimonas sp.]